MSQQIAPIRLDLGFSTTIALYLVLIHLLTVCVIVFLDLGHWPTGALLLAVIWSLQHGFCRHILFCGDAVTGILLRPNDDWLLTTRRDNSRPATLLPGALVHPWLSILVFRLEGGTRRAVVLTADGVASTPFRRLRVRLRH